MKKVFVSILFFSCLSLAFLACKKEDLNPNYPFTITVKTYADSIATNNIKVDILAPDESGSLIPFFTGYTNEAGQVSFEYEKDAVFIARATRGADPITHIGCADVHLKANERVYKTVYLQPYDSQAVGCSYSP